MAFAATAPLPDQPHLHLIRTTDSAPSANAARLTAINAELTSIFHEMNAMQAEVDKQIKEVKAAGQKEATKFQQGEGSEIEKLKTMHEGVSQLISGLSGLNKAFVLSTQIQNLLAEKSNIEEELIKESHDGANGSGHSNSEGITQDPSKRPHDDKTANNDNNAAKKQKPDTKK